MLEYEETADISSSTQKKRRRYEDEDESVKGTYF
jgi:hypothetical protein